MREREEKKKEKEDQITEKVDQLNRLKKVNKMKPKPKPKFKTKPKPKVKKNNFYSRGIKSGCFKVKYK